MSNLFSILNSAGGALGVFQAATAIVQNNVSNASTPGYARQDPTFDAAQFSSDGSVAGGVLLGPTHDGRSSYAEQTVRNEVSGQGYYSQLYSSLSGLDALFDVSTTSGMTGAMTKLFTSFSSWASSPDSPTTRQSVIDSANTLASAFQQTAKQVNTITANIDRSLTSTADQINQLAIQVQTYNKARLSGSETNASLDASLNNTLETLSGLTNIVPMTQPDGTVTVLIGGQTPLVMGDKVYQISVGYPSDPSAVNPDARPHAAILGSTGKDITSDITEGELGGLLHARNVDIPSLIGDGQQQGTLNILAQKLADRVNSYLTTAGGPALFTYSSTDATSIMSSLSVNPAINASQLAANDPGPPVVSNGTALKLAGLGTSTNTADQINGLSLNSYLGAIGSDVGRRISDASDRKTQADSLVTQAQSLRSQISGVSLDQEAIRIMELQRSYQASARVITVVDQMATTLLGMFN